MKHKCGSQFVNINCSQISGYFGDSRCMAPGGVHTMPGCLQAAPGRLLIRLLCKEQSNILSVRHDFLLYGAAVSFIASHLVGEVCSCLRPPVKRGCVDLRMF